METLDQETHNKVLFIVFMIARFAKAYKMSQKDAYDYLCQYGGYDLFKR
jgi:hypothetical protein